MGVCKLVIEIPPVCPMVTKLLRMVFTANTVSKLLLAYRFRSAKQPLISRVVTRLTPIYRFNSDVQPLKFSVVRESLPKSTFTSAAQPLKSTVEIVLLLAFRFASNGSNDNPEIDVKPWAFRFTFDTDAIFACALKNARLPFCPAPLMSVQVMIAVDGA